MFFIIHIKITMLLTLSTALLKYKYMYLFSLMRRYTTYFFTELIKLVSKHPMMLLSINKKSQKISSYVLRNMVFIFKISMPGTQGINESI